MPVDESSRYITYEQMNLINDFRQHWIQLAIWSGLYINNRASDSPSIFATIERLNQVPSTFYTALSMFYGAEISEQFSNLLNQHIVIFRRLVDALKSGDQEAVNNIYAQWYSNADDIAGFLAQLNPYWSKGQWQYMLYEYLNTTTQEAIASLSGDFRRAITIFDRLQYEGMLMADYMSRGIMQYLIAE